MISGFKKGALGVLTFASVVGGATPMIIQGNSTAIAAEAVSQNDLSDTIDFSVSQLPKNGKWSQGSAPEERFQTITGWMETFKQEALTALEKESLPKEEQNTVENHLSATINAITSSRPVFPNANDVAAQQGYQMPNGVVSVTHYLPEKSEVGQSYDTLNSSMKYLKTMIITSLKTPGPASKEKYSKIFGGTYEEKIKTEFQKAEENLYGLLNKATNINASGLTVTHQEKTKADETREMIQEVGNQVNRYMWTDWMLRD